MRSAATFDQLNTEERIRLVQDLWDEIAATPEHVSVSDDERAELDRRLEEHHTAPGGSEWSTVKARILGR
jgi:putative addiction module component (TIGR02574 family)